MVKSPKSSKPGNVRAVHPGSLGEGLDEVGYQPLGRRIVVGKMEKAQIPPPQWIEPVIDFLSSVIPRDPDGNWEHLCIGALELGCELLVRLGRAKDAVYGAKLVANTGTSDPSLRWDDVATIVIAVAAQMNLLGFRAFAGTRDSPTRLLRPNIRAANGSGPAYLANEAFAVFRSLGLVFDGSWTDAAETVLWRECPEEWAFDFTEDERFIQARNHALTTVPPDIVIKIAEAVTIREQDVVDWLAIPERHSRERKTRKHALDALHFWARHALDGIFIRRWRFNDGWLSASQAKHGICIELDPLALNMRAAFAAQYLPHLRYLTD